MLLSEESNPMVGGSPVQRSSIEFINILKKVSYEEFISNKFAEEVENTQRRI